MRFEKGIAQLFVVREERVATVVIIPTDVVIFELGHDFTVVLVDVQEFVKRVQREFPVANVPPHTTALDKSSASFVSTGSTTNRSRKARTTFSGPASSK
jgi:hypothetical protein